MSATQEAKRIRQNHLLVVGLLVATLTLGRPASSSSLTERPGSPRQHQQQQVSLQAPAAEALKESSLVECVALADRKPAEVKAPPMGSAD